MPVIPEHQRLIELRKHGLSESVIQISAGEAAHDFFEFRCKAPPYFVYHGAASPRGPIFIPLWECCETVTGLWEREGGLEFLGFSIEAPDEPWWLSKTEQGMLASLFVDFYQDYDDLDIDGFREPARLIGFRYLEEVAAAYESLSHLDHLDNPEHEFFRRALVDRIDRLEV